MFFVNVYTVETTVLPYFEVARPEANALPIIFQHERLAEHCSNHRALIDEFLVRCGNF